MFNYYRPRAFGVPSPTKPSFHEKWHLDDCLALPQGSWFLVNGLILSPGNPCWWPVVVVGGDGVALGGGWYCPKQEASASFPA